MSQESVAPKGFGPKLSELLEALKVLPGVGEKTAARMAVHLLTRNSQGASRLSEALREAVSLVKPCERCRMLAEDSLCAFCQDTLRDSGLICVVQRPSDVFGIERTGRYRGRYFVLNGHLSPMEGLDGEALGLGQLESILEENEVRELILATASTPEGELTAHYIQHRFKSRLSRISVLAQGAPIGHELEYLDLQTLAAALQNRALLSSEPPHGKISEKGVS